MTARRIWFERRFQLGLPPQAFPDLTERLRGTPARLEERLAPLTPARLTQRLDEAWSIQENAGHLLDLEPLWETRLMELLSGAETLAAADLQNRKTHQAGHNDRAIIHILRDFRTARARILSILEGLGEAQLAMSALHPRLQLPMTAVDLSFFVAEHDDHHLARITEILGRLG